MPATADVTLAILAGGESSRMGRPKAQIHIDGKPIVHWMLQRLSWPGPTMLVVSPGHQNPPGRELFASQVCDPVAGAGPLRGVLTVLENLRSPLAIIATVDMPGIGRTHLDWLIDAIAARDDLGILMSSHLANGRAQAEPFPSAWRVRSIDLVRSQLAKGDPSVRSLARSKGGALILAPQDWPASVWTNLNTPEDLATFLSARS